MGRLGKSQKDELRRLKSELNHAKDELIMIEKRIREISQAQADRLGTIIGRLEDYQHR